MKQKKSPAQKTRISKDADYIIYRNLSDKRLFAGSTYRRENGNFAIHTAEGIADIEMAQSVRKQLLIDSGFDRLVTLKQVHSDTIHYIHRDNRETYFQNELIEGDGVITDLKHVLIGVLTADCVPVYFTDNERSFCAIVHAGWKGLQKKVHMKMLHRILETFPVKVSDLNVLIGPHIRGCCYEVKKDVVSRLKTRNYKTRKGSKKTRPSYLLDMESIILDDLKKAKLKTSQIYSYPVCTKCSRDPSFYSYRNGDVKDRFLSFVGLI